MSTRKINKNVSTSALSRADRAQISELEVVLDVACKKSGSRTNKSVVWQYFGALHITSEDGGTTLLDDERLYCR